MGMGAVAMVGASFLMAKTIARYSYSIAVEPYERPEIAKRYSAEQYVLAQLQEHTRITDRNAIATIMVALNRKASLFLTYARETGSYESCHSGVYGLIQWTSIGRYNNLGKFCRNIIVIPAVWKVRLVT